MRRGIFTALAFSLGWAPLGQGQSLTGLPVTQIAFSPPNQPLSPARLDQLVRIKPGDPLQEDAVRQSIQALFATGRYADIKADAAGTRGAVKLTFITEPNWFIGQIRVPNVKEPPSAGELASATKLQLGEPYTEEKMQAAKEALQRLLADNGYASSTIAAETFPRPSDQQLNITFQVDAGERARFGSIHLLGRPDLSLTEVRQITGWSETKPFTQPRVRNGLDRLRRRYQKRGFLRASVRMAGPHFAQGGRRADVDLTLEPGPRVEVAVTGARISQKKLRQYIPIYEEGAVDEDLLLEGAFHLRSYFESRGYFDANVEYELQPEENGVIRIQYQVELGARHRFLKLEIAGAHYFDEGTIRERLLLQPATAQNRHGRFTQDLVKNGIGAIEDLYHTNGFLAAHVTSRVQDDFEGHTGDIAVFLSIEEGPQTLVGELKITGNDHVAASRFQGLLSSLAGQPFSETNVASDRDEILNAYFEEGFADATLEWRSTPGAAANRVILEYTIHEGAQQFVNRVIASGYERTREAVVERQIAIHANDPLSQTAMVETQRRLYNLGVFSQVEMAVQNPEGEEQYRNVIFEMREARRWTVGVGGGAQVASFGTSGTDLSSPAGATGVSPQVTFDVNRLDVFGTPDSLNFRSILSTIQQRFLASFQSPQWRGHESLTLTFNSLYDNSRNVNTFTARRLEGGLQLRQRLGKPSSLYYRISYRRVSVEQSTLKITPELIPLLSQPVRVGMVSAAYVQDRRDDPLDTRHGIYNTVDTGIAGKFSGSGTSFVRLLAQNTTYHPLSRRLVLARTTQFGALIPFAGVAAQDVPLPERFFSGGPNFNRGFAINQAGPRDPVTGFPIGGDGLLLNSVELRFPLHGTDIGGVIFHDAGNVYSEPQDISFRFHQRSLACPSPAPTAGCPEDFNYLVQAVGFGVRYKTPIGPVSLDLAYSINPPQFTGFSGTYTQLLQGTGTPGVHQQISHFQFHLSLGQTF